MGGKIETNLSMEKVLALKDVGFQLLQKQAILRSRRQVLTITTFPIHRSKFRVLPNLDSYPTSRFSKTMCWNPIALRANHKMIRRVSNSWMGTMLLGTSISRIWSD